MGTQLEHAHNGPGRSANSCCQARLTDPSSGGSALTGYNGAAAQPAAKILYRVEDAAELMSLSRTAIFDLIRTGDLDTIKVGRRRRIPLSSIEAYVTRHLGGLADSTPKAG